MSLKHGLLGLLNYESMTGYDLDKEFKQTLAYFWQAKASQIYRELDTMEQNGWLTSKRVIQEEKPNKRVYSITEKGKQELLNWLSAYDTVKNSTPFKSAFLMRIFFGGEISKEKTLDLFQALREETVTHVQEMEKIMALFNESDPNIISKPNIVKYWKLTAMSGEMLSRTQLEWIDKSIALLEEYND